MGYRLLATALFIVSTFPAAAQIAILQVRVLEGEGGVHIPGSRARPITVEVTDETGKPVSGAAVSFHLPGDGPGGTFVNGLRTTIATTDVRGRATIQTLQVNRIAGQFQMRIVASKDQARAGIVSLQYISGPGALAPPPVTAAATPVIAPTPRTPAPTRAAARSHSRWIVLAAAAGGGIAAGILAAGRSGSAPTAVTPPAQPPVFGIGTPSITVGKP